MLIPRLCAGLVLAMLVSACGGGSSPSAPSAPPQAPRPARSVLTLGASENIFTIASATRNRVGLFKCGDTHVLWTVTESAGLPAAVGNIDAYLLEADGDIVGRRVTAANATVSTAAPYRFVTDRLICGYEGDDLPVIMKVSIEARDENGNTHTLTGETGFVER